MFVMFQMLFIKFQIFLFDSLASISLHWILINKFYISIYKMLIKCINI